MQQKNLPIKIDKLLILVGGGRVDKNLLRQFSKDGAIIIAADGGAQHCAKLDIIPKAIIGDMDSIKNKNKWVKKTQLIELREQETTDFEKCLNSTNASLTIALGMSGKRLDHTLSAIQTISNHALKRNIILVDEKDIAIGICGYFSFKVKAGDRVSIHPLANIEFENSTGLQYPLDGLTLAPYVKGSTSNKALAGQFSITPKTNNSPYLLILPKPYLKKLIKTAGVSGTGA